MASDFIVNVSEADFEYEVLNYSQTTPVVVDFWATWCIPCKVQSPVLEKLAREGQGTFRLAKVDVDANLNLAKRFNIRTIPAVKAFNQGQVVSEFSGPLPETRLREFIQNLVPSPSRCNARKRGQPSPFARMALCRGYLPRVLSTSPNSSTGLLGLLKSLLSQGLGKEALIIVQNFPPSHEYATAEILRPLAEALTKLERGTWMVQDDPLSAAFYNSVRLASRGNIYAALDGLLDVIRQDKRYQNGQPRQLVVALLELLGDHDPQTRQYRQELASILF